MTRYKQETAKKNGFTDWIFPKMTGYKMACCDCGLVHDFKFKIVQKTKVYKKFKSGIDEFDIRKPAENNLIIGWKVRRNNRATGQIRRKIKNND